MAHSMQEEKRRGVRRVLISHNKEQRDGNIARQKRCWAANERYRERIAMASKNKAAIRLQAWWRGLDTRAKLQRQQAQHQVSNKAALFKLMDIDALHRLAHAFRHCGVDIAHGRETPQPKCWRNGG